MARSIGHAMGMLRLVLPKGSLENATLDLFLAADLAVKRTSDVDYRATIDDPRLIGSYFRDVLAKDVAIEPGNELPQVCQKHGWATFRPELETAFVGTTRNSMERNSRVLELLCTSKPRKKAGWLELCEKLSQMAVDALQRIDQEKTSNDYYLARETNSPALLVAFVRSLLVTEQFGLLAELVDHALALPKKYPFTKTHIAALTTLKPWLAKKVKKPAPGLSHWIESCCRQLEERTAQEPQPPADFRRDATISCKCADCAELKGYLEDPREEVHRFRFAEARRRHLEGNIRSNKNDLTCSTDRKGSPHSLVCTKTIASYEAKLKKYHRDQENLAILRSIQASMPR